MEAAATDHSAAAQDHGTALADRAVQTDDVVQNTLAALRRAAPADAEAVRLAPPLVAFSVPMRSACAAPAPARAKCDGGARLTDVEESAMTNLTGSTPGLAPGAAGAPAAWRSAPRSAGC